MIDRTFVSRRNVLALAFGAGLAPAVLAQGTPEAPDAFIRRLSADLLDTIKKDKSLQSGDPAKVAALVDQRVMPHLNFQRMTASAVGPGWRQANPEQQKRLQEEFKTLLMRTYTGALRQANELSIVVKPARAAADDKEVLVRSEIVGRGEPVQLDYRVERAADAPMGWRIYNFNVMGIWLIDNYRNQFAQEINARGVDGLITTLAERNQSNRKADGK